MATIRKRNYKWHVQIRRKHHNSITKTFLSNMVAQKWIRETESKIDQGCLTKSNVYSSVTFKQLILRYMQEELVKKKSCYNETITLGRLCENSLLTTQYPKLRRSILPTTGIKD